MIEFSKNKSRGFTLVESLTAITVFSLSLLAVMTILSKDVANTGYAQRRIVASYLASEGIEYIRNMRDTYVLYPEYAGSTWDQFKTKMAPCNSLTNNYGCSFDPQNGGALNMYTTSSEQPMTLMNVTACPASSCPALLYNLTTGKYNYVSGTASGFVRKISTRELTADEMLVTSTVYWLQGSGTQSVVFTDSFFNWTK